LRFYFKKSLFFCNFKRIATLTGFSYKLPAEMTKKENLGLYDPAYEHDACGIGFVANINDEKYGRNPLKA